MDDFPLRPIDPQITCWIEKLDLVLPYENSSQLQDIQDKLNEIIDYLDQNAMK